MLKVIHPFQAQRDVINERREASLVLESSDLDMKKQALTQLESAWKALKLLSPHFSAILLRESEGFSFKKIRI